MPFAFDLDWVLGLVTVDQIAAALREGGREPARA